MRLIAGKSLAELQSLAYRWLVAAEILDSLRLAGFDPPAVESVLRPLTSLTPLLQAEVWQELEAAGEKPTAGSVTAARDRL